MRCARTKPVHLASTQGCLWVLLSSASLKSRIRSYVCVHVVTLTPLLARRKYKVTTIDYVSGLTVAQWHMVRSRYSTWGQLVTSEGARVKIHTTTRSGSPAPCAGRESLYTIQLIIWVYWVTRRLKRPDFR